MAEKIVTVPTDPSQLDPSQIAALQELLAKIQQGSKPKERKKRRKDAVKYLTEEQLDAFFGVIKSPRDTAIFRLMYHRGLRASELGKLQLSDWNRDRDRIRFARLKGSHGGEYHLTSREVRVLRGWLKVRGSEPGPLFLSRNGKGISRRQLDVLMKRYGRAAGLPTELCHVHSLKHSCATHLLNRGESIEDVQDHLGHANIQSTMLYAKVTGKRRAIRDQRLREW
jgi:site-specific recombinase XerC